MQSSHDLRLIKLRFNIPLNTKQVISTTVFAANLLASIDKIKINTSSKNNRKQCSTPRLTQN